MGSERLRTQRQGEPRQNARQGTARARRVTGNDRRSIRMAAPDNSVILVVPEEIKYLSVRWLHDGATKRYVGRPSLLRPLQMTKASNK